MTEGIFAEAYDTYNSSNRKHTFTQTTIEIDGARPTYIDSEGKTQTAAYGTFYSIVDDPERSGNKVLSVNTKNTNGAKSGTISLDVEKSKGARVHVIEYDLYFQSNIAANNVATNKTPVAVRIMKDFIVCVFFIVLLLLLFFCVFRFILEYFLAARCPGTFTKYIFHILGKNYLAVNKQLGKTAMPLFMFQE